MSLAGRGPVRVLLLWPGTGGAAAGNFGVPQLLVLATYARAKTGARIDVRDLEVERVFGPVSLPRLLAGDDGRGYDVIALACYASYDYLKCLAIAEIARALYPEALIAAGGYHASARPGDIVFEGSPFDVCVVGEGERPLVRIIESVAGGAPLRGQVLGPDPIEDLAELPRTDWSFLARYLDVARKVASQAQVYLSRGCPFECAFCMERAKREVSWRALPVERAIDEVRALHEFLHLETWTLYVADALFGMKRSWRRSFLEALAREKIPARKLWLLIRVDLVEDEDLRLFGEANCGLGFGLESGDPELLAAIRKAGRLDEYLERMLHVSARARELGVPWGANIIVGHPGETEDSMRKSAAFMEKLFLDPRGITGFLSVDPFRFYPGSPIDVERSFYEARYGARFHRPAWWHDGDQEFLSEWVDPSRELSYRRRAELQHELFAPLLARIGDNFVYRGPARDYFMRAIAEQVALTSARRRLHDAGRYYAWSKYLGRGRAALRELALDEHLAALARELRAARMPFVARAAGLVPEALAASALGAALERVPRERFVPLDRLAESADDVAVPLDDSGAATLSAMHAYVRTFTLLDLSPGDALLDLGAGTGYGCAIASEVVGPAGRVHGVEIDPRLAASAQENLRGRTNACVVHGDALEPATWGEGAEGCAKVSVGFAIEDLPTAWARTLPEGALVVAPLRVEGGEQRLVRAVVRGGTFECEFFERVRYVTVRRKVSAPRDKREGDSALVPARQPRRLPVLRTVR